MIRVVDHRDLIDRILLDHGLGPADLDIVSDIQAWCRERGVDEANPLRMAKCFCHWTEGKCHILLTEHLSESQIRGGIGAMETYGFGDEVRILDSPLKFLVHLILHEVAAHVLKTTEQKPRDAWAFERVPRYAP